jgi:hypothetical protein
MAVRQINQRMGGLYAASSRATFWPMQRAAPVNGERLESNLGVSLRARPKESIGFVPEFANPRVHLAEFVFGRPISVSMIKRTREAIHGVDRVIVYSGSHIFTVRFLFAQGSSPPPRRLP